MAKVDWAPEAEDCLRDIHDFVAETSPESALKLVQSLIQRSFILREFPELGYRLRERPHEHIRVIVFGQYRMPYRLKASGDIDIIGVFHGRMDMERLLRKL